MTQRASGELFVLVREALDAWYYCGILDISACQSEWTATYVEDHGPYTLSFWRGPETEAMALLTEGQPAERTLAIVDHRPVFDLLGEFIEYALLSTTTSYCEVGSGTNLAGLLRRQSLV